MLRTVGRYRLMRSVGSDALTQSHEGIAIQGAGIGGRVIVRMGKLPVHLDPQEKARFDADARAASALTEALAAPVIEHGVLHGLPYVVHPWMEGRALGPWLEDRTESLTTSAVIAIGIDLASVLASAHALDPPLVHGGVCLDALFVDDAARVRLAGYALGALCTRAARAHPQLASTIERFAPKDFQGPAADVYALGAVMRFAGTKNGEEIAHQGLRSIVLRATERDPSARASAEEIRQALRELAPRGVEVRDAIRSAFGMTAMSAAPNPELKPTPAPEPEPEPAKSQPIAALTPKKEPPIALPVQSPIALPAQESDTSVGMILPEQDTDEAVLPPEGGGFYFEGPTYVDRSGVPITELLALEQEPEPAPPPPQERTMLLAMPPVREEPEEIVAPRRTTPPIEAPSVPIDRVKNWFESPAQPTAFGWPVRVLVAFAVGAMSLLAIAALLTVWLAS